MLLLIKFEAVDRARQFLSLTVSGNCKIWIDSCRVVLAVMYCRRDTRYRVLAYLDDGKARQTEDS